MIVTADEALRAELRGLRTSSQVAACARFRDRPRSRRPRTRHPHRHAIPGTTDPASRRRDRRTRPRLRELLDQAVPQLIAERGIGYITAAAVLPRLVTCRPLPQRSRLRSTRRYRTGPRHLRAEPDPPSLEPWRRPPAQPSALPRRRHQATLRPGDPHLHRLPNRRGQDRTRSHPLREALPRPPRLATPREPDQSVLDRHRSIRSRAPSSRRSRTVRAVLCPRYSDTPNLVGTRDEC